GPALLRVRPDVYDGHPPAGTHLVAARPGRICLAIDHARRGSGAPVPILAVVFLRESAHRVVMAPTLPSVAIRDLWALSFRLPTHAGRAPTFSRLARLAGARPIWNWYRPTRLGRLDATVERSVEERRP